MTTNFYDECNAAFEGLLDDLVNKVVDALPPKHVVLYNASKGHHTTYVGKFDLGPEKVREKVLSQIASKVHEMYGFEFGTKLEKIKCESYTYTYDVYEIQLAWTPSSFKNNC